MHPVVIKVTVTREIMVLDGRAGDRHGRITEPTARTFSTPSRVPIAGH